MINRRELLKGLAISGVPMSVSSIALLSACNPQVAIGAAIPVATKIAYDVLVQAAGIYVKEKVQKFMHHFDEQVTKYPDLPPWIQTHLSNTVNLTIENKRPDEFRGELIVEIKDGSDRVIAARTYHTVVVPSNRTFSNRLVFSDLPSSGPGSTNLILKQGGREVAHATTGNNRMNIVDTRILV